jgi:putative SOS response-associated peptidase YedK
MCGRFVQAQSPEIYSDALGIDVTDGPSLPPRFNVAPTLPVLALRTGRQGLEWVALRWGLIPGWSAGPDNRFRMINARAETIHERPAFRDPFRYRRCLIPADGFYEWRAECGGRQPYFIRAADGGPLWLAGLWDHWSRGREAIESCAIVVTAADPTVAPLHDRMPVALGREQALAWLDPTRDEVDGLRGLLMPTIPLALFPVSIRVNRPDQEGPDLVAPIAPPPCPV